jgi:membrane-bound serine protease (ClpP class)
LPQTRYFHLAGIAIIIAFLIIFPIFFSNNQSEIVISVAQGSSGNEVVVIQLYEQIDQGSAGMVSRGISRAQIDHAAAVIIDMNTPGGLLSDMITMIDSINSSSVPVYTFVGNDSTAASAGSYVAMATKLIFMAPGSQIGPSTPFVIGGAPGEQQHVQNFAFSLMQGLAQANGRNATAAGIMVSNNTAYYYQQAIQLHVANALSVSLPQTFSILGLSGDTVVTISENLSEQTLSFLSNSTVDGLLLIVGMVAIVLDFLHPTIILSIAGIVLIALALIGAEAIQGPNTTLAVPLVLFAVAGALIVLELKTGHGFMMFAGVVVGAFATVLLSYDVQYSPSPFGDIQVLELVLIVVFGALLALYARWVGKTLRKKPFTGREAMIGKEGLVSTDLSPEGEVIVDGIIWKARILDPSLGTLQKGSTIIVRKVSGLTLLVEPQGIKEKQLSK